MSETIHIKVAHDDDPENPREWDSPSTMACWHDRYNLGDVQPKEDPDDWMAENAPNGSIVLSLYLYDHSGITMSCDPFGCQWDSGQVGVLVCTPETIDREWNGDRALAEAYLRGEVAVYDQYLRGDCWGYVIEKEPDPCDHCGQIAPFEDIDSCFGFFGDALEAMRDHVDDEYHDALTEAWEQR